MSREDPARAYAEDVLSGDIVAGEMVRLACQRHLDDLTRSDLVWRPKVAEAYLQFFRVGLVHTIGAYHGKPFEPLPWQAFILANLYGWHRPDGSRRFNYSYISMARKQGKTTLMAGAALAALVMDREQGAEVYSAATKRDQARILFDEARRMVNASPALRKYVEANRHRIEAPQINGKMEYLSSDGKRLDGTNPHCSIIDEYHAHPTDEVFNVLKSGMQARRNPLHLTITTAGLNKEVPCYKLHQTAREVLRGIKTDDSLFAIIYELDEEDHAEWTDPRHWVKANPSLGATITTEALRKQCTQALNMGTSFETEFKTKHLNLWTSASSVWIQDEAWMACRGPEELPENRSKCVGGLDLAAVSDLTALVLSWEHEDKVFVRGEYWLPRDTFEAVIASNPGHIYRDFEHLPNFHLTDGNVTDFASIRRILSGVHLKDGVQTYDPDNWMQRTEVEAIAFDRHNSTQIAIDLSDDGVPLAPYGQGFVSMSPGAKELEVLVRSGRLSHDGDPVLRWAIANVELRQDPAGNIKPDKGKSAAKIDPAVALVMAIGERLRRPPSISDDMLQVVSL